MPIRWVICPVIETVMLDGTPLRYPKVEAIRDAAYPEWQTTDDEGNLVTKFIGLGHSSVIELSNWCLSFVRGQDFSLLDADVQVINVFEAGSDYEDIDSFLANTPRSLNWKTSKVNRIKDKLLNYGVDLTGITLDTPLWQILQRVGQRIRSDFPGPKGTWVA